MRIFKSIATHCRKEDPVAGNNNVAADASIEGTLNSRLTMRKAQILWLGATMVATGSLLLTLQTRPEHRDTWFRFQATERFEEPGEKEPRFDEPDAAARADLARRQPA